MKLGKLHIQMSESGLMGSPVIMMSVFNGAQVSDIYQVAKVVKKESWKGWFFARNCSYDGISKGGLEKEQGESSNNC